MGANESAEAKNSKTTKFMERNSLHDVHKTTMRNLPITTRLGSRRRIYLIFVSEGIIQMVQGAGYRTLHEGIKSDHIMLWTDLDFKEFFGGSQARPSSPQAREFSYNNLQVR